jgi:ribonuclease BN (tRNA processing enzyme)
VLPLLRTAGKHLSKIIEKPATIRLNTARGTEPRGLIVVVFGTSMKTRAFNPATDASILVKKDEGVDVFFIGTGSAFSREMNQTNLLIVKGDTHVLVDFGMTGPRALRETANIDVTDIQVVLPTHSHADHIGGFEALALMNRYIGRRFMNKPKIRMVVAEKYEQVLWDSSLRGGLEHNEGDENAGKRLSFADYFDVIRPVWKTDKPRETFDVEVGGLQFEMFRTKHIPEMSTDWSKSFVSFGVFVKGKETVFISGDTRFDTDLIDYYADKSDVMFHDVQFFPGAVHAPLEDLRTLPASVKQKMYFMHYADNWRGQDISGFAGFARQGVVYSFE